MKYRIHIQGDDKQIKEELREVAEIITGLREAQIRWQNHYGSTKVDKEKWELRADQWINKHKVFYEDKTNGVKK